MSSPGAIAHRHRRRAHAAGNHARNSAAIRSKTGPQAMCAFCRKIRIVGYHGLSSRWVIQRQSGVVESAIHDRHSQRSGQVRHGRVGGDEQVEVLEHRRRVHERSGLLVQLARPRSVTGNLPPERIELLEPGVFLKAEEPDARDPSKAARSAPAGSIGDGRPRTSDCLAS